MIQVSKVIVFALAIIGFFAGFANLGVPEIKPALPPPGETVDVGDMDMDAFIALGERLFNGKGTCTLCHSKVGGRAPMLDTLAEVIPSRLDDDAYTGTATSLEEYLIESMDDPSTYVVRGFGKVGTNDTESPMPSVRTGSIGFSEVELLAVVAYLQEVNGLEVTVSIPDGAGKEPASETGAQIAAKRAPYTSGEEIVAELGCGACHKIAEFQGELGPDLSRIGRTRDLEHLRRSILNPADDITEGFPPIMPTVYGDQLYASELEVLIQYLASLK